MKTTSRVALVAAAGLFVGGVGLPSAKAADLGGDCCADLEERVAELEATTARKGNRKVSLTISGHVNRSVLWWDDGFKSDVYSVDNAIANTRFRFTGTARISPQLTAGFLIELGLSIGARSHQVSQVDDDGVGAPLVAGADGTGGAGDAFVDIALANWWLTHQRYGTLTVGRINGATAGWTTVDLGGIGVIANSQPFLWGGGFLLRNGAGLLSPTRTWGSLSCGADATFAGPYSVDCGIHSLSRRDGVSYTTPTFSGFTASASWGEDDYWDTALRYAGEICPGGCGFRVAAAIGYRWYRDREGDVLQPFIPANTGPVEDTHRTSIGGSASILHVPTGLFASGSFMIYQFHGWNTGESFGGNVINGNRPDFKLWWLSAGIVQNWTGLGNTSVYGEYGQTQDGTTGQLAATAFPGLGQGAAGAFPGGATTTVLDSNMNWWGFGVVQNINAAAMELYVGYRHYEANAYMSCGALALAACPGGPNQNQINGGLRDIDFVQAGARIQF